ncbi:hypothetical protein HF324_05715 [Chitinophaga oryzae]|uniref:Uncharacterized protein n=1 Tax=Chitinophaga oryzae TaxID=2725414 RepID=A0AAE7D682_9BACT|nr:hypothetical protein [Chitinophaga oryzae]QJB30884.1 hypothetical protein HF329_06045 [Chitinophaga oryzae]QJB37374.1 hypothetical protein HF324_05715 [Chitinophaga oryzae]
METKTLSVVTALSMIFTLTAAVLSIAGIAITGFYPAIAVFLVLALIPIASRLYAKKMKGKYNTPLIVLNSLLILVVLWMAFVIVHDRVLGDCC